MFKKFLSKFKSNTPQTEVKVFNKKSCLIHKHYVSRLNEERFNEERLNKRVEQLKEVQRHALQNNARFPTIQNHQKNYSTKCLDFILNFEKIIAKDQYKRLDLFYGKDGIDGFLKRKGEFITKIENSVKFHIPDEGHILDIELTGNAVTTYAPYLPHIKLPYERLIIEFETLPLNGVNYPSVMVCEQFENHIELECFTCYNKKNNYNVFSKDFWSIQTSKPTIIKGQWNDLAININGTDGMDSRMTENERAIIMSEHENIHILFRFLAALSCSNISIETEIKPDAKLNKARAKKGKVPLFEYKVLKIDTQATASIGSTLLGTHASPRTHLRRGHIRRLRNGTTVWVNGCVVRGNNKGIITKEYVVV